MLFVDGVSKSFVSRRNVLGRATQRVEAVKSVSLHVQPGETLGLVGESGSGKSTVGRLILRLIDPDTGRIEIDDVDVAQLSERGLLGLRSKARMIFQDPFSSLDPKRTVAQTLEEVLQVHNITARASRRSHAAELLSRVGLAAQHLDRYPHEFSGGQLQRVAVARAIATQPKLVVCDEPVASLDMSIRAQVMNLLGDLQASDDIAYVFISHDLSLVRRIADRVAVMRAGEIVETGPTSAVLEQPDHPYTRDLLAAVPVPDPGRRQRSRRRDAGASIDSQQHGNGPPISAVMRSTSST